MVLILCDYRFTRDYSNMSDHTFVGVSSNAFQSSAGGDESTEVYDFVDSIAATFMSNPNDRVGTGWVVDAANQFSIIAKEHVRRSGLPVPESKESQQSALDATRGQFYDMVVKASTDERLDHVILVTRPVSTIHPKALGLSESQSVKIPSLHRCFHEMARELMQHGVSLTVVNVDSECEVARSDRMKSLDDVAVMWLTRELNTRCNGRWTTLSCDYYMQFREGVVFNDVIVTHETPEESIELGTVDMIVQSHGKQMNRAKELRTKLIDGCNSMECEFCTTTTTSSAAAAAAPSLPPLFATPRFDPSKGKFFKNRCRFTGEILHDTEMEPITSVVPYDHQHFEDYGACGDCGAYSWTDDLTTCTYCGWIVPDDWPAP